MTQDPDLPGATAPFPSRMTRQPRAHEPDRGAETAALFPELPPELRDLIAGVAGSSPYLKALAEKERDWLGPALSEAPETAMAAVLDEVRALEEAALAPGLRQAKRRVALLTALADLAGVWPLEAVTGALTDFADLACDRALRAAVAAESRRGKLPGGDPDDPTAGGMVALAMGKMGAHELNYSSDIDLICLFDDSRYGEEDFLEARAAFVRATRKMCATLSDITGDGYVFRTDLRLRPDAAVTPVCLPMEAAERYYESLGRTWERAAHVKARPSAGDLAAGNAYLDRLRPFIWRRHLDYAAIQDAHDMRLRIRDHKGLHGRGGLPGYDLKLGPGGIREIEFFTQTRQIIAGGRDAELRDRGTVAALRKLAAKDWVKPDHVETLIADYRAHREVEHRVQMVADQQTHALPKDDDGFDRLAALMGTDAEALKSEIAERLERVGALTEDFFAPSAPKQDPARLSEAGREIVARWRGYPALRTARAREIFERVRPELLARLERASHPDEALSHIDGFLAGLPSGVQLFSLFEANPQLLDLVVDIADVSPDLARYLARNAGVFDAVIGGSFFGDWPGAEALTEELSERLSGIGDYEQQLDAARAWAKDWHFRIGVHFLRGLVDAGTAGRHYADLAEAVVAALTGPVVAEFARKHGPPPGRGAVVVGMGSLGAARLTAASDLDLIVIYDADGQEASDGPRPLPARSYFARLTQAFVTALTAPMAEGRLYEVDMRLRPSGKQGPVATSWSGFQSYQREEAWTWEHLAQTRARPVAGDAGLAEDIAGFRAELLASPRDRAAVLGDVGEMRTRLATAKPGAGGLDAKFGPGRMMEIELLAQTGALLAGVPDRDAPAQLRAGAEALGLVPLERDDLTATYDLFWRVQAAIRLIGAAPGEAEALGAGAQRFLLSATGQETLDGLMAALSRGSERAAALIDRCLGSGGEAA